MRRALTFFTGNKIATAATAAALSVVTTATLVAGGMLVTRVIDFSGDRNVAALPAIDAPSNPIIVKANRIERAASTSTTAGTLLTRPASSDGAAAAPRTASLLDVPEQVKGGISTALDSEEPGRMNEVSTIERIESLLQPPQHEEEVSSPDDDGAEPEPEESEDQLVARSVENLTAETQETVDSVVDTVSELDYSGTAAGSASPSV